VQTPQAGKGWAIFLVCWRGERLQGNYQIIFLYSKNCFKKIRVVEAMGKDRASVFYCRYYDYFRIVAHHKNHAQPKGEKKTFHAPENCPM